MSDRRAAWALGAMSGTSLDGVDAAMVLTDGVEVLELGETGFRAYSKAEREVLRRALGQSGDEILDSGTGGSMGTHGMHGIMQVFKKKFPVTGMAKTVTDLAGDFQCTFR